MEQEQKLGAGIKVISILILVFSVIAIIGIIFNLSMGDKINEVLLQSGQIDESMLPTTTDYIISLIFTVIGLISVILILMKKQLGIYGYFGSAILGIVYDLVANGIQKGSIISIILNIAFIALYAFFIYKKREVFGFKKETTEVY